MRLMLRCNFMSHASLPRTCLSALLLLPAAAFAQPQAEGRIDAVTGEDSGDRPIPEVVWEERLQGLYAVEGACGEAELVWAFALDTVEMGRTVCTALGKMTFEDDWLHVPASQCVRMGESVEDRWIALRGPEDGAVLARVGEGEPLRLLPCLPPGE